MDIKVYYKINKKGQEKAILAGEKASQLQCVQIPCVDELLKYAYINKDGDVVGLLLCSLDANEREGLGFTHHYNKWLGELKIGCNRYFNESLELEMFPKIIDSDLSIMPSSLMGLNCLPKEILFDGLQDSESMLVFIMSLLSDNKKLQEKVAAANAKAKKIFDEKKQGLQAELRRRKAKQEEALELRLEQEAEEEVKKELREKAREEEMRAWIKKFGSERLKLALNVDLLEACRGVYRTERIQRDLGDRWELLKDNHDYYESETGDLINPPKEVLEIYKDALENNLLQDVELTFEVGPCDNDRWYCIKATYKPIDLAVVQVIPYD